MVNHSPFKDGLSRWPFALLPTLVGLSSGLAPQFASPLAKRRLCYDVPVSFFNKKNTLTENMAFMALMAAIDVLISLVGSLVPVLALFLMLLLPLVSTLVELYCRDRYYLIYAAAAVGLSLVATMWNMQSTIFSLIPALATGYFFGLMIKKGVDAFWAIFAATVAQAFLSLLAIPFINWVYETDLVEASLTFFKLGGSLNARIIVPTFVYAISLTQVALSYLIVLGEIRRFGYSSNAETKRAWLFPLLSLIFSALMIPAAFLSLHAAYLLLALSIHFAVYAAALAIRKTMRASLILLGVSLVLSVFLFALFYQDLPAPKGLLLAALPTALTALVSLLLAGLKKAPADNRM